MRLLGAFFRLVRWPNLLFIIITQLLFYFCVCVPVYQVQNVNTLFFLIAASVFIAASGYIINDYFDLNIDQINKPDKNVFAGFVKRRWAIVWHFVFNVLGLAATIAAVGLHKWYLVLANLGCMLLLWLYSTSLKRKVLIGNLVISLLTAWTVLILFYAFTEPRTAFSANTASVKFFRITFLYAGFAFVISLIREAVKDVQDLEGDARYGCKTLPIVFGLRVTKMYLFVWIIVLAAALIILQLYMLQFNWWLAVLYSTVFVIVPLLISLRQLSNAKSAADFGRLSLFFKWLMLTGIFSMVFFKLYISYA